MAEHTLSHHKLHSSIEEIHIKTEIHKYAFDSLGHVPPLVSGKFPAYASSRRSAYCWFELAEPMSLLYIYVVLYQMFALLLLLLYLLLWYIIVYIA